MADVELVAATDSPGVAPQVDGPGVSVIIIFLDALPFLGEAIDSVIGQTYRDWELILVDDGSSDGSTELAKKYAASQPHRIQYVEHAGHQNLGMSASRNLGMQASRGGLIAFLDGDDVYLPERLQRHVRIMAEFPQVDMVQSDLIFWYSWQPPAQRQCEDQIRPFLASSDRILKPPEGLLTVLAVPFFAAGICNITVRRRVALELRGFEPGFRAMYEDQVFTSKLYLEKTVYVLQDYLARYRRHPTSWVRRMKASGEFVEGMGNSSTRAFHTWLIDYVRERGVKHALLNQALAALGTAEPARASVLRGCGGRMVTASKQLLLRLLPRPAYRRLLHWNWQREVAQALRRYRSLCRRMERSALARNTVVERRP